MHPEFAHQIMIQRQREAQARAAQHRTVRALAKARRAQRRGLAVAGTDDFIIPAIPDYVDGSFRVTGTDTPGMATSGPATRHAA
jgi:hypothetical protein